jgi:YidC/Oxa1 family membrane protein insertase
VKRKKWIILAVVVLAMLVLTGCGVPYEGVDVTTTQPDGPWQTFVVWPLANILISIETFLANLGVYYAWGWAIILFTLLVKLLTFPLSLSQIRGMQAQKDLQPRLQELQKKHGKDREKLAQEQMRLYQEAGVNPLSGCLPLVIQMPILFGLYAALVAVGPMMQNAAFFWIPDLAFPQYTIAGGIIPSWITDLWQAGDFSTLLAYLILPILLVVTQVIMQKWMTPAPVGNSDSAKMTQNMTMIMTLFFGYFTLQVPAGLTLYWVTSNVLQMLQQWAVTRFFMKKSPEPAVAASTAGTTTVTSEAKVVGGTKTAKPAEGATNPPATRSASNQGAKGASRTKAKGK